ncbi:zinc transporter ZIP1-like isoform X1 [Portunus trituberculatus]|uniref:zinc transporter ZIP1-like isoform X1 n=1 Tax=Portunus trituberculatus TaxID=210409 RepID=UPI001E1D03CA|nr:zinc transporter ZIP1-like isoform X1 [Portunus trituberculatus]
MEVYSLQFLFMGIIFLLTTGVGLAPVLLRGVSKKLVTRAVIRHRILSCASCFGAGVFIFVCFMGLLPAADRKFHHFLEELGHTDESWEAFAEFPWGFFVVICGFLIIFTIDKLVHVIENQRRGGDTSNAASRTLLAKASIDPATHITDSESNGVPPPNYVKENDAEHEHGGHGVPTSIIFLLALGVHSLFEGMAVGLQTQKEKVLEFSVAVLVHELVMAFSFGMEVSNSNTLSRWGKGLYVIIFTSTIPLGIAAGVGLQSANSAYREIVSAVLEAFATGIFIHVIFIEVLAKEFPHHHHHHRRHDNELETESTKTIPTSEVCLLLEKVVCICCGIATLILLSVFMHAHH